MVFPPFLSAPRKQKETKTKTSSSSLAFPCLLLSFPLFLSSPMASKRISKVRTAGKAIAAPEHERKTKREERRDPMLFFFSAFLSALGARLSWCSPSALSLFGSPLRLRDDAASSALSLAPVACRWKGGFFGSRGGAKRKGKRGEKTHRERAEAHRC